MSTEKETTFCTHKGYNTVAPCGKDCPTNQPIEEKWKEEFNKKFCSKTSEPKYSVWNAAALAYPEEIKSFIENLLEQERKRKDDILDCIIEDIDAWIPLDVTTDEIIELVRGFKEAIINK